MKAVALTILLIATSLIPGAALAQGFGINEQDACAMGRGGAATANPCDNASGIYFNPAALGDMDGWRGSAGFMYVGGTEEFTSDRGGVTAAGRPISLTGQGYLAARRGRFTAGFGAYVPYGLGISWPLDFAGRFVTYESRLQTVYFQPTVSVSLSEYLSVGVGYVRARGSVTLKRREDLSLVPLGVPGLTFGALVEPGTDFVDTDLSASGASGNGFNVGVQARSAQGGFQFGARYLSRISLQYSGDATFTALNGPYRITRPNPLGLPLGTPLDPFVQEVVAALPNQPASTSLEMPAQFSAGISARRGRWTALADLQHVSWSVFDAVVLDFSQAAPPDEQLVQNYRDTWGVHTGVEYRPTDAVILRGGYFANQAAAPDTTVTPLLPEAPRQHLTAGLGLRSASQGALRHFAVDVAFQWIHHADRRGRVANPPSGQAATDALNTGTYRARGRLFGVTVSYRP